MTTHSKYFYEVVKNLNRCNQVTHDGGTCWESTIWNFTKTIPGCTKFVLPLALVYQRKYNDQKLSCIYNFQTIHSLTLFLSLFFLSLLLFLSSSLPDSDYHENTESEQRCVLAEFSFICRVLLGCLSSQRFWSIMYLSIQVTTILFIFYT